MIYVRQEIDSFTYSNIESTADDFSLTTNYLVGDMVRVGNFHYKATYGTVELPNVGKPPLENIGTAWFEYEPSNAYACLDQYAETRTEWEEDGILEFVRGSKNTLGIGFFTATKVRIEYRDNDDNIMDFREYFYSTNGYVYDEWSYGYGGFSSSFSRVIYLPLLRIGTKIRIIFSRGGLPTSCGYLIAGVAVYMGDTLEQVTFPDKRIGNRTVSQADFSTIVKSHNLMQKIDEAKLLINEPMMFVIDNHKDSVHQNMVILGKINQCSGAANNFDLNQINWQIEQNILT